MGEARGKVQAKVGGHQGKGTASAAARLKHGDLPGGGLNGIVKGLKRRKKE